MNKFRLNKTDSRFFKQNLVVWEATHLSGIDKIFSTERRIIEQYNPLMITVFLPVNKIQSAGYISSCGYQIMECRLLVEKELTEPVKSYNLYPYEFLAVTERQQLNRLKKACLKMVFDDRFFTDPEIDNKLALERNLFFLEQSYKRKNEFIYILQNSNSNKILGFRSFKLSTPNEAVLLINGFLQNKENENYHELINLFELELLYDLGMTSIKAVISVQNHDEINRYLSKYGYRIYDSKVLFRKILNPQYAKSKLSNGAVEWSVSEGTGGTGETRKMFPA